MNRNNEKSGLSIGGVEAPIIDIDEMSYIFRNL